MTAVVDASEILRARLPDHQSQVVSLGPILHGEIYKKVAFINGV